MMEKDENLSLPRVGLQVYLWISNLGYELRFYATPAII